MTQAVNLSRQYDFAKTLRTRNNPIVDLKCLSKTFLWYIQVLDLVILDFLACCVMFKRFQNQPSSLSQIIFGAEKQGIFGKFWDCCRRCVTFEILESLNKLWSDIIQYPNTSFGYPVIQFFDNHRRSVTFKILESLNKLWSNIIQYPNTSFGYPVIQFFDSHNWSLLSSSWILGIQWSSSLIIIIDLSILILDEEWTLTYIFIFALLWGASKGFMKAWQKTPQKNVKIKI